MYIITSPRYNIKRHNRMKEFILDRKTFLYFLILTFVNCEER